MRISTLLFLLVLGFTAHAQVFFHDFDSPPALGAGISNPVWSGGVSGALNGVTGTSYSYQGSATSVTFSLSFDVAEGTFLDISNMAVSLRRSATGAGATWSSTVNGIPAVFTPTTITIGAFATHTSNTSFTNLSGTVAIDFTFEGATPIPTCLDGSAPMGCGTIRLDNFQINGVLPITLSNFKISKKERPYRLDLDWNTASEHNNAYFSIERSADGKTFVEIAQVRGAGNSFEPKNYAYADEQPLKGLNYYRLRQVDFDGSGTYSRVVSATFGKTGDFLIAPSPATNKVQLLFEEPVENGAVYEVFDQLGRLVLNGIFAGENAAQEIDLALIPKGTHVLRVVSGRSVLTKQFQKQ